MIKVYLDSCAIQRPLDTPTQTRVALEAEAVLGILFLCDAGRIELVSADYFCTCDDQLLRKAKRISDVGVKVVSPLDMIQEIEQ
ncbi:MAG: hypothetical protein NZ699_12235 [Roseiflexus sp.]|nr:hypothetical protein [Roseiflexus sp.]MDW8145168.1 hypothetical protein [Roseiflexaceae bacterium]MDW8234196.1 hypothetical protein [Roseiflexaceae bacterium]